MATEHTISVQSGSSIPLAALRRRVRALREECSVFEAATALMKQDAERKGGAPARFAVDAARSPAFAQLRAQLHLHETMLAEWKKAPAGTTQDRGSFGTMMARAVGAHRKVSAA